MMRSRYLKTISLALVATSLLASCSQEENADTDLLQVNAYLDVAELYRDQGQFRAASIETRNALQVLPENIDALYLVSQLYMDLGDNAQAITQLNALRELYPDDIDVQLLLAEAHINTLNPQAAMTILEDAAAGTPQQMNQRSWLLGMAHASSADFESARETFGEVLEREPSHVDSLLSMSNLEYRQGNVEEAESFLEQAIAIDQDDLKVKIWQGELALLQERYPESEQAFFEALNTMGNYDTMTAQRFSVLQRILIPLQMQQKNDEALRYSQIIAETPQNQFLNAYSSAVSFFESGNFDEAETALNELLVSAPDHSGSNILLGMVQYAQGDYAAAEASLTRLANVEGASPQIVKTLAATHLRLEQPSRAMAVLTDARERYPDDASVIALIGATQQTMGETELAIATFEEALALQPNSADIHYALAGSYFALNDESSAIASLSEAIRVNPSYTQAKSTLSDFYFSRQDFDSARTAVQSWLDQEPNSIENINFAGRVAFAEGNTTEARQFFESSIRGDESNVLAKLFLARIDLIDENYPASLAGFSSVLAIEPNNVEALSGILTVGEQNGTQSERIAEIRAHVNEHSAEFTPPLVLSQYYILQNELQNANEFAQIAYARNDNSFTKNTLIEVTLRQANNARQQQDSEAARRLVDSALELERDNIQVLTTAAGLANDLGEDDQASAYVSRIKELQPDTTYGFEIEGDLFIERGELENALASYQEAWNIDMISSVGIKMHQTLTSLGRTEDALALLTDWIEEFPADGSANLLLGMTSQQENREDEAIEYYEVAIQEMPDNIVALNNLAWLYQDSSPERALELSSHAAELFPENADVLDTHGWILFKTGNQSEAIDALQRAAEIAPDSPAIAEHLRTAQQ